MKTFRILCTLIASADLEAEQWDVIGAFLNSDIPDGDEIYVGFPEGFKKQGLVLRLHRGLYRLRQSPKLWFDTWAAILDKFGLIKADKEACLWMNDWLILFFYVDDVISAFNNRDRPLYEDLMTNIRKEIEIQELGELKWFLGICMVRHRPQRRLWISQASYIEKIATRFSLTEGREYDTPLPAGVDFQHLIRSDQAPSQVVNEYQQMVGSIQYAATGTRPDVARAASQLAQFSQNPSAEHRSIAERVIQYLYYTRDLALQYTSLLKQNMVHCYTDTSFADDSVTRRSSHGYLTTLYGAAVDWKSAKQTSVSTSSTEAKLRALEYRAKSLMYTYRLFKSIQFNPEQDLEVNYDNRQTIHLVESENPTLVTALRHVDVAHHWVREQVQQGILQINWVSSAEQSADGLTKALPGQKHRIFLQQLGLVPLPKDQD
ncbi:hypothetical protein DV736_g5450, partial [Chaetothyriales sp. CBS 134916]